jgi:hypothetical protein
MEKIVSMTHTEKWLDTFLLYNVYSYIINFIKSKFKMLCLEDLLYETSLSQHI